MAQSIARAVKLGIIEASEVRITCELLQCAHEDSLRLLLDPQLLDWAPIGN